MLKLLALVNARRREDVSLPTLAALAHRSKFNLHRRFVVEVGETPKGYTSRVRLARAAADLLATTRPTSVIALDHGFASHEVFTRAFTRHFGMTPRDYRARGLRADDDRTVRAHAATVASVAPCVGLYHTTVTERRPTVPVDVAVKDLPEVHALIMRRRITRDQIAEALSACLPAVFAYAQKEGLALAGPPFARYPEIGMGSLVMECGVAIAEPVTGDPGDGIEALTIPAGPAAVAIHRGPYDRLTETFQMMEAWIQREGRTVSGPPRETYLTDPGEYPDPETWETEVVIPLLPLG
jgi:AraC family transcriptional regulator